jgi:hypothetical protein
MRAVSGFELSGSLSRLSAELLTAERLAVKVAQTWVEAGYAGSLTTPQLVLTLAVPSVEPTWDDGETGEAADAPPPPHDATSMLKVAITMRLAFKVVRLRCAPTLFVFLRKIIFVLFPISPTDVQFEYFATSQPRMASLLKLNDYEMVTNQRC